MAYVSKTPFLVPPQQNNKIAFSGFFLQDHTITSGGNKQESIKRLKINNCSSLQLGSSEGVVKLPDGIIDQKQNKSPDNNQWFSVAKRMEIKSEGNSKEGRVLITADSGFLGDSRYNFRGLGPGLLQNVDNFTFFLNGLRWLAKDL